MQAENTIIKFYYCISCGGEFSKRLGHAKRHFKNDEFHGYSVHYEKALNKVYVTPIYSSASVATDDGMFDLSYTDDLGWLYVGTPAEFNDIASRRADIKVPSRTMSTNDYNFQEMCILYDYFQKWYHKKNEAEEDSV